MNGFGTKDTHVLVQRSTDVNKNIYMRFFHYDTTSDRVQHSCTLKVQLLKVTEYWPQLKYLYHMKPALESDSIESL